MITLILSIVFAVVFLTVCYLFRNVNFGEQPENVKF